MKWFYILLSLSLITANSAMAIDSALQAKIDEKAGIIAAWGQDPELVSAVKELNANPPEQAKGMDQGTWASMTLDQPRLRYFMTNKVASFLKGKKAPWVGEAFVSLPDGTKAGFLGKTTSWSHKGKPKHDVPMTGKTWQGELEVDQSSGRNEIQVAAPVLDGTTPIDSLVVGVDVSAL